MTKIYVDTEFNGFGGQLISMALVAENGLEFYEVLVCKKPVTWVEKNVIPHLGKDPISIENFRIVLQTYLWGFRDIEIIADWPEDIVHFCSTLLTGPGIMLPTRSVIAMTIDRSLGSGKSKIPHNALEDARAIMQSNKN